MQSAPQVGQKCEARQSGRPPKSFSNRAVCTHLQPYSQEYSKAKQKAYERYKKIYPIQDKQNLYPLSKTPYIGFYVMKGYRHEANCLKEAEGNSSANQLKSSDKIIGHMLKKYLHRKEHAQLKQTEVLPKIDHSLSVSNQVNRTSIYIRPRKHTYTRVLTEFEETETLKPMVTTQL